MINVGRKHQVTDWYHPKYPVEIIQDGRTFNVGYDQWCQLEVNRWLEKNYRNAWVEQCREEGDHKGDIALFTDYDGIKSITE